jgi:hypothetical protein
MTAAAGTAVLLACRDQVLIPGLAGKQPGATAMVDNLKPHEVAAAEEKPGQPG